MTLVLIVSPLPRLPLVLVATNQHIETKLPAGSTGQVPYEFISGGGDDLDPEGDEQSAPTYPTSYDGANLSALIRPHESCGGRKPLTFCVILSPT